MIKTKNKKQYLFTPLRYPGGKTRLTDFFGDVFDAHAWRELTYIEPYAGGAGAALALLMLEKVKDIVINDYDPAIYSFWKLAVEEPDKLIDLINKTPITVDEWNRQKEIYRDSNNKDYVQLGFATFFLNRANRSGVINAGPIGGKHQNGKWKINARFNKDALIERIRLIQIYSNRINVTNTDGVKLINKHAKRDDAFFYIDPPYYVKGADLYLNSFADDDHRLLANTLRTHSDLKWILSYDNVEPIRQLYVDFSCEDFSLSYSVHHNTKSGSELMVFSDVINTQKLI